MLNGNELFRAQEDEGDQIRRDRRQPEPEFVRSCIRYVTIWRSKETGKIWPSSILHETYDAAESIADDTECIEVAAVRAVRIDL